MFYFFKNYCLEYGKVQLAAILITSLIGITSLYCATMPSPLFVDYTGPFDGTVKTDPTISRNRVVKVNFNVLYQDMILANLFPDISLETRKIRVEKRGYGQYSWFGQLAADSNGYVILVINTGKLTGNALFNGIMYQVRPLNNNGIHVIYQVNQSAFPNEAIPLLGHGTSSSDYLSYLAADNGNYIDTLVVYTDDTRKTSPDILSEIHLAIDETNYSYEMSNVNQRLRLAHAAEINYKESGKPCKDLQRLWDPTDGKLDQVHLWRDTYCADVVSMWVEKGGGICGCGYLMSPPSPVFEQDAFSVVQRSCATGYYSFGHELGHNMGAHHDRYVAASPGAYDYSHGYVNLADAVRTIMAYNTNCIDNGFSCTRIPGWSNPNIFYNGHPMGLAEGDPKSADNHKTLDNTAFIVANFRNSCVYFTPTAAPTNTFTLTPSATFSPTYSPTPTISPTFSPTSTQSPTRTPTYSPTSTSTYTPTLTHTNSPTNTFTPTFTRTLTSTPSFTHTYTYTFTNTFSPTYSPTYTLTIEFSPSTPSPIPVIRTRFTKLIFIFLVSIFIFMVSIRLHRSRA